MYPTLTNGDFCFIWLTDDVDRGDVIILDHGGRDLVKRVIGIPNDRIFITRQGIVIEHGGEQFILEEPYKLSMKPEPCQRRIELGQDEYWVMGDNRPRSGDSREFGPISKSQIKGRVLVVLWRKL